MCNLLILYITMYHHEIKVIPDKYWCKIPCDQIRYCRKLSSNKNNNASRPNVTSTLLFLTNTNTQNLSQFLTHSVLVCETEESNNERYKVEILGGILCVEVRAPQWPGFRIQSRFSSMGRAGNFPILSLFFSLSLSHTYICMCMCYICIYVCMYKWVFRYLWLRIWFEANWVSGNMVYFVRFVCKFELLGFEKKASFFSFTGKKVGFLLLLFFVTLLNNGS